MVVPVPSLSVNPALPVIFVAPVASKVPVVETIKSPLVMVKIPDIVEFPEGSVKEEPLVLRVSRRRPMAHRKQ